MVFKSLCKKEWKKEHTVKDVLIWFGGADTVILRMQAGPVLMEIARGRGDEVPYCFLGAVIEFFVEDYSEALGHFLEIGIKPDSVNLDDVREYRKQTFW